MENLERKDNNTPVKFYIEGIYNVDGYLVIHGSNNCVVTDGENVYYLGKYKYIQNIYKMGNKIYAVVLHNYRQSLIDIETLECVLSQKQAYCSGIFKVDDNYINLIGSEYPNYLYNINTKNFIKPDNGHVFSHMLVRNEDLFVFQTENKYEYSYSVVDGTSKVLYECGRGFPHKIGNNLVIHNSKEENVKIVVNLFSKQEANKEIIISINDNILGEPQIIKDNIVIVTSDSVKLINTNLEEVRSIPIKLDGEVVDTQLEDNTFIIVISKGEKKSCVIVLLNNELVMYHDGVVTLPFEKSEIKTIRCYDELDQEEKDKYKKFDTFGYFSLYDTEGTKLTTLKARDCWVIESSKNNKFIFYNVDGLDTHKVYNVETKELKDIPWDGIDYCLDGCDWASYGWGYNELTNSYDFFDEDLNVLFADIDPSLYGMRYSNDLTFKILNNYLWLDIRISKGPCNYYHNVIIDKDKNVIYDSYNSAITILGNYFQIKENDKLIYLDSRTGTFSDNRNILLTGVLPKSLSLKNNTIELSNNKSSN